MSDDKNERWGYASYDVDKYDDYRDSNLQYTRYDSNGSVKRFGDNGDGGHSHTVWKDADNYNTGGDPDFHRSESNDSPNPSIGDIQNDTGCYLTTACMKHMKSYFDDKCDELQTLRWFRDNFVSCEDIKHYYKTAPVIVKALDELEESDIIYNDIYMSVIAPCVAAIKSGNYDFAYKRYKDSILELEETYARPAYQKRLVHTLKCGCNR